MRNISLHDFPCSVSTMRAGLVAVIVMLSHSVSAGPTPQNPATTCNELVQLTRGDLAAGVITEDAIKDCLNRGIDLPPHLRSSGLSASPVGNSMPPPPCKPVAVKNCPNTLRKHEREFGEGEDLVYSPNTNPLLNIPDAPWKSINQSDIPCGAVATFTTTAIRKLLGDKVQIGGASINDHVQNSLNSVNGKLNEVKSVLRDLENGNGVPTSVLRDLKQKLNNEMDGILADIQQATNFPTGPYDAFTRSLKRQLGDYATNVRSGNADQTEINGIIEDTEDQVNGILSGILTDSPLPDGVADDVSRSLASELGRLSQTAQTQTNARVQAEIDRIVGNTANSVTGLIGNALSGLGNPHAALQDRYAKVNQSLDELIQRKLSGLPIPQGMLDNLNQDVNSLSGNLGNLNQLTSAVQGAVNDGVGRVRDMINSRLTSLIGGLFKNKDCQDGRFWGILEKVASIALGRGTYTYNVGRSSFINPTEAYITLPVGSFLNIDINQPPTQAIRLPLGGKFYDGYARPIRLKPGEAVKFRSDGLVRTSSGDQYRVYRNSTVKLDPNEIIEIPAGSEIPVRPDDRLYPVSPVTKIPDWLNQDYVDAAR